VQKVCSLIADSADTLHYMTPFGTWLHVAAKSGNLDIVRVLISLGIKILMESGVDFRVCHTGESMKNMDGEAFARERGQTDIANYLAKLKTS
jgi:hypothetical protein